MMNKKIILFSVLIPGLLICEGGVANCGLGDSRWGEGTSTVSSRSYLCGDNYPNPQTLHRCEAYYDASEENAGSWDKLDGITVWSSDQDDEIPSISPDYCRSWYREVYANKMDCTQPNLWSPIGPAEHPNRYQCLNSQGVYACMSTGGDSVVVTGPGIKAPCDGSFTTDTCATCYFQHASQGSKSR